MTRTRLIRPEFYADELMAELSIHTRFVYIGLWTLCDDAGYFERKPRQIAAALFPFDPSARRQRIVDAALGDLERVGRVRYLECGSHAVVPTLPRHGAKGGTKAETHLARHKGTCLYGHVSPRTYESSSDKDGTGTGSVSDSVSEMRASAREDDDGVVSEFRLRVDRDVALGGRTA